jgi:PAS domain S-box-containing protein
MAEKIRVLLVDDEQLLLDVGKKFLERDGNITVSTAESASQAFDLLKKQTLDAIISDYQMPDMDGIQFLKAVRKEYPALPFILFTGKGSDEIAIEAFESGADYYVKKVGAPTKQFAVLAHRLKLAFKRRQEAERFRQSEERYRTFIETASEGIVSMDASLRILFVNQKMADMLGYSMAEITGKVITGFMYPEDLADNDIKVKERFAGGTGLYERRFRHRDGSVRWMLVSVTPLKDKDGAFTGSFAMFTDITERKQDEEALRESGQRIIFSLDAAEIGAWDLDLVNHTAWRSLRHDQIFGYEELLPEWTYEMFLNHVIPEDRSMVDTKFGNALKNLWTWDFECRIRRKDGAIRWIWAKGRPEYNDRHEPTKMFGIVQDITERKQAADNIALSNRKLALMNDVSYQYIQNKVTAVRGYAELSKDAKTETERLSFIEEGEHILADIHHLIKDTRDYQEIGLLLPGWIPAEQSIRIAASIISPGPGISVLTDLHGLELYFDPIIEKIFSNLIDNAVRHGKTTTRITFSCEETPEGLSLICEDDGVGISLKDKAHLFDRSVGENIHFGLFFVRECLLLSGMTIAETSEPGKGARFEITVPKGAYRFTSGGDTKL